VLAVEHGREEPGVVGRGGVEAAELALRSPRSLARLPDRGAFNSTASSSWSARRMPSPWIAMSRAQAARGDAPRTWREAS
jgi:hypothetical protein